MANWGSAAFCSMDGCTRPTWGGSRYCRFCQRKGAERDLRIERILHKQALEARRPAPQAWRVLLTFCVPDKTDTVTYAVGTKATVKLAHSRGLATRLEVLQTGNHERLQLLASIDSSASLERHLHRALRQDLIRGDWFCWSDRTQEVIRLMREGDLAVLCKWLSDTLPSEHQKKLRLLTAVHEHNEASIA